MMSFSVSLCFTVFSLFCAKAKGTTKYRKRDKYNCKLCNTYIHKDIHSVEMAEGLNHSTLDQRVLGSKPSSPFRNLFLLFRTGTTKKFTLTGTRRNREMETQFTASVKSFGSEPRNLVVERECWTLRHFTWLKLTLLLKLLMA